MKKKQIKKELKKIASEMYETLSKNEEISFDQAWDIAERVDNMQMDMGIAMKEVHKRLIKSNDTTRAIMAGGEREWQLRELKKLEKKTGITTNKNMLSKLYDFHI